MKTLSSLDTQIVSGGGQAGALMRGLVAAGIYTYYIGGNPTPFAIGAAFIAASYNNHLPLFSYNGLTIAAAVAVPVAFYLVSEQTTDTPQPGFWIVEHCKAQPGHCQG